MKKFLAITLAVIMAAAMCACQPKAAEPAAATAAPAAEKPLRVMLSNAYYTVPYCAAYNKAAEDKAKELGIDLTILDGEGNQQKQLEQANTAIADKYDGFLYFPADVDGALPVIEALNAGGIKWMGVNAYLGDKIGDVGMKYYFGPDSSSHGHTMAKVLMEKFPDGANVIAIEGTAGHQQTIAFNNAFDQDLDKAKYIFIDRQDCDFKAEVAMTKMTDMLTAYGIKSKGGKIDCIICHDGGMLTGVVSALEAAGLKPGDVPIIACGSNKIIEEALKKGWLSASSTQDPSAEGSQAVEMIYNLITGKTPVQEGWTKLPTPVAYPDTVSNFHWF